MSQNKSNRVELYVSTLLEDLKGGLSWYKKDDQGFGSIQEKYDASDNEVLAIKNHPALKNAEPTFRVFVVIDDTKDKTKVRQREAVPEGDGLPLFSVEPVVAEAVQPMKPAEVTENSESTPEASVNDFMNI